MKITAVDKLPEETLRTVANQNSTLRHRMREMLDEFLASGAKYAKVDYTPADFKNVQSAYNALYQAYRIPNLPLRVRRINGELYLTRVEVTDL